LRHDNADRRLSPLAYQLGLVGVDRHERLQRKLAEIDCVTTLLDSTWHNGVQLSKYVRRPDVEWSDAIARAPELAALDREVVHQVLCDLRYAGYVARQQTDVDRQARLAQKRIPTAFNYDDLAQLRAEAREKLTQIRPRDLSQASRISGITPADIALLMVHLGRRS
jgi:tRNA uridine 5-carboxymethylaminomethyl modification enzyme